MSPLPTLPTFLLWSARDWLKPVLVLLAGFLTLLLLAAAGLASIVPAPATAMAWQPPLVGPVTQGFGCTAFAGEPPGVRCPPAAPYFHSGVDFAALTGAAVHAAAAGTVRLRPEQRAGYGQHLIVEHGRGTISLYAHLSAVAVETGTTVRAGQVVGQVGSSGNSTGPHLHFEIRVRGEPVDPLPWLSATAGGGDGIRYGRPSMPPPD